MSLEKKLETRVNDALRSDTANKAQKLMGSKSGVVIISAISFLESALPVPILTDPFLIATILSNRAQVVRLVVATTLASVVGGIFAFFLAVFFLESLLQWMTPGIVAEFQSMIDSNESSTFMMTIVGAVTPVPYTIVAWVVAVLEGSLAIFIGASVLGRGLRYTIVGYCTYRFGPLAVSYAKRYLALTSLLVVVIVALYVWLHM